MDFVTEDVMDFVTEETMALVTIDPKKTALALASIVPFPPLTAEISGEPVCAHFSSTSAKSRLLALQKITLRLSLCQAWFAFSAVR
jgi:hypothetical protein